MRRAAIAALAAAVALIAPAASHADAPDASKPVVFISGEEAGPVDCGTYWDAMKNRLRRMTIDIGGTPARFTGEFKTLSDDPDSKNCAYTLGSTNGSIRSRAGALATWLYDTYSSKGQAVDIVAQGTAGVVVREALGAVKGEPRWPHPLLVEDVVTLSAPFKGSSALAAKCPKPERCLELDPATELGRGFLASLAEPDYANPQGYGGTDWTVFGSDSDELVSAESATAMDANHKTIYTKPKLTHAGMLADAGTKSDATLTYQHRGGQPTRTLHGKHVADRVAEDLVFGAPPAQEDNGCTGSNDTAGGPVIVADAGLKAWKGPQTLSYFKSGVVEAYSACFKKISGGLLASDTTVRLNGLDITPEPGQSRIVIDPSTRRVTSDKMSIAIPSQWFDALPIPLEQDEPLDWTLPKSAGALSANDIDGFGFGGDAKIAGLKIKGSLKLSLQQGSTVMDLSLALPGILSGSLPTGGDVEPQCDDREDNDNDGKIDYPDDKDCKSREDNYENPADGPGFVAAVKADNVAGLVLDKISGTVEGNLRLGSVQIGGGATVSYSRDSNEWALSVKVIPPFPNAPIIKVGGSMADGELKSLSGEVDNMGWGPIGTTPLYLQRLKLAVTFRPDLKFAFGTSLSVGPRLKGKAASEWVGDLTIDGTSASLAGKLLILGDEWGSGSLEYKWAGGATLTAEVKKSKEFEDKYATNKLSVNLNATFTGTVLGKTLDANAKAAVCIEAKLGFIDANLAETCLLEGNMRMTIQSGVMAFSDCAQIDLGPLGGIKAFGFGFKSPVNGDDWTGTLFGETCDVDDWHAAPADAAQAGGARVVSLDGGDTVIAVVGRDAPPRVALRGPGGAVVDAPAKAAGIVRGNGWAFVHSGADATTYVMLAKPAAGRWTIEPQADSAPVTGVRTAGMLPAPSVRARVSGHGAWRTLTYDVKPIPGQVVRFREPGGAIGTARGSHGTLRFRPAFGRGGVRAITADVVEHGYPRTSLVAGRYTAPAPRMPGAPSRVVARRRGGRLTVGWSRVAGASGYSVGIWTPDGRAVGFRVRAGAARRVSIRRPIVSGTTRVMVRALRPDGRMGRAKTLVRVVSAAGRSRGT